MTPAPRRSCPEPTMPEFGLLMCRARDDAEDANDAHRMPEGSECTVSCSPPHRLQQDDGDATQSVVTKCSAGRWNVTSWTCVRAPVPDADLDGDISAVLSDAGAAHAEDWDWKANSLTDPCSPNPCHSGGKCLRGPTNARALCQCRPGTEGERCERVLCRATCLHGGRCVLLQGRPSCFCHRGFAGSRCQALVKNVRFPAPTPVPALTTPVTTPVTTPTTASAIAAPSTPSAPPRPSSEAPNG
ncbi:neurogenic locus notch homolog protein 4-like [Thrips palmi]|uniref:Neurogenic locus notch homolog protein 4-like n=1 Tax=Thrips palmi TaxID=161013 RepID=A0A6P8Y4Q7_THRPL|nr:neurogenic locus notch homolog protein 4-like [Thrips palmi]